MPSPFLSSEEYDERAHELYNEGNYDEALSTLREGLALYPNAVELHVGVGYARLARDEFAWARRSFEESLVLDPDHEDALAGLGETLLKFGQTAGANKAFQRILELGYQDDVELMLQVGRALFRDGMMEEARQFLDVAIQQEPDHVEGTAMIGYVEHRLGNDDVAIDALRRVLQLDPDFAEARIYLGNLLFDRGEFDTALYHFERTLPEDHWDELGIWRLVELRKSTHQLSDNDPSLKIWDERLAELTGDQDATDVMLSEIERAAENADEQEARGQLELFGALLADFGQQKQATVHHVVGRDGRAYDGSWDEIVEQLCEHSMTGGHTIAEYMQNEARRGLSLTGHLISTSTTESFLRDCADAGLLRIVS